MIKSPDPERTRNPSEILLFEHAETEEQLALFHNTDGISIPSDGDIVQLTEMKMPLDGPFDTTDEDAYYVERVEHLYTMVENTEEDPSDHFLIHVISVEVSDVELDEAES